jgi:ribosome maturation factor RimP
MWGFGPFFCFLRRGTPPLRWLLRSAALAQEASAEVSHLSNVEKIITASLAGLGLELVEFERAPRGLLRVFIDKPLGEGAVTVEDCSRVSHQLTATFAVEGVDYDRLEVSSPGLDRLLKLPADFERFKGLPVRVRLYELVNNRKRFDALMVGLEDEKLEFRVVEVSPSKQPGAAKKTAQGATTKQVAQATDGEQQSNDVVRVHLAQIEKIRLIPQF